MHHAPDGHRLVGGTEEGYGVAAAALFDVHDHVAALEGVGRDVFHPGGVAVFGPALGRHDRGADDPVVRIDGAVGEEFHAGRQVMELVPDAAYVYLGSEGGDEFAAHRIVPVVVDLGDVGAAADLGDVVFDKADRAVGVYEFV